MTKRAKRLWMFTGAIVLAALLVAVAAGPIMSRVERRRVRLRGRSKLVKASSVAASRHLPWLSVQRSLSYLYA